MNSRGNGWIWHHIPYVVIGIVALYLITEPGSHHSAPFAIYLLFLPLPLVFIMGKARARAGKKNADVKEL
jgi:hypothetical protein